MTNRARAWLTVAAVSGGLAWYLLTPEATIDSATQAPEASEPPTAPAQPSPAQDATVTWVPDGDTIHVTMQDGATEPVRLIGINAPEDSPKSTECGGREATAALRALAPEGTRVRLIADPTQGNRDRYGRLLRYIELHDGQDLAVEQLRHGHAEVHVYDGAYQRLDTYRQAEEDARVGNPRVDCS